MKRALLILVGVKVLSSAVLFFAWTTAIWPFIAAPEYTYISGVVKQTSHDRADTNVRVTFMDGRVYRFYDPSSALADHAKDLEGQLSGTAYYVKLPSHYIELGVFNRICIVDDELRYVEYEHKYGYFPGTRFHCR